MRFVIVTNRAPTSACSRIARPRSSMDSAYQVHFFTKG